ncbi:MAG: putative CRISPR-associated protein [Planctomycetes bacterium]|nr:putative CRISPR-associated protein [Planctomycetota bacterium]
MTERLLLVSTCGTSLLTNPASEEVKKWLTKISNEAVVVSDQLSTLVSDRRDQLLAADESTRRKMSAELNGIGAVLERYRPGEVFHVIIHTDTAVGKASAELIEECLGSRVTRLSAGGLRTDHLGSFRAAIADITKQLDEIVRSYQEKRWFVVFNLTGGFKSLNGYLQTLAMISADRCVFLFESAPELMEIPRLPVRHAELEELRRHVTIFRRLAVGYSVSAADAGDVPESLLIQNDSEVTTSVLGDVAWARHRSTIFAEKIHETLSKNVRIADPVRRTFNNLEATQKVQVNEALDEFCAYIDLGRPLPKSRTFKKLQGNPVPGSSHELYAWSGGATGRLFGHDESQGRFVFDRLDSHLP